MRLACGPLARCPRARAQKNFSHARSTRTPPSPNKPRAARADLSESGRGLSHESEEPPATCAFLQRLPFPSPPPCRTHACESRAGGSESVVRFSCRGRHTQRHTQASSVRRSKKRSYNLENSLIPAAAPAQPSDPPSSALPFCRSAAVPPLPRLVTLPSPYSLAARSPLAPDFLLPRDPNRCHPRLTLAPR